MPYSRRELLRSGSALAGTVALAGISGCLGYGWKFNNTITNNGKLVSFASRKKRITKKRATHIVKNERQLVQALAQPNAVIWIPGAVTITINGRSEIPVAPGVTLASNRNLGKGKSKGGRIRTTKFPSMLFTVPEGTVRVTGIRLQGPMQQYFDPPNDAIYDYAAGGIHFKGKSGIVDNCEMYGWTSEAVGIGTKGTPTQGWIHHNNLHHNQMNHLGYPMEIFNGFTLVEWNTLSYYRHAITGYGYPSNGYEARFNIVGPPGGAPYAFAFDMHSLGEQSNFPESNTTAGKYVNVHHNVFRSSDHNALSISGIPTKYARFCNNWCAHGGDVPAVSAPSGAAVRKKSNVFGSKAIKQGQQWLTKIATQLSLSDGIPSITPWTRPKSDNKGRRGRRDTANNTTVTRRRNR